MSQLGEALRRERQRRSEKQRDTARRFGVSQPSYHRWESGASVPADEQRQAIANFLGVTVQELWEMIHRSASPTTLDGLQAEVAELKRDIADLRDTLAQVTESLNARL